MKKSLKQQHLFSFLLICILSGVVYSLTNVKNWRFDLTEDNRFTLSETTKETIKSVDDLVYIKVFLEGEGLPAEFNQLNRETKIMLNELRSINTNIEFEFLDPLLGKSQSEVNDVIRQFSKKGIQPSTMLINEGDARKEKIFFPWALLTYKENEIPINLFKSNPGATPGENIQNSLNALEYEWVNALKRASSTIKPLVGFVKGHGELEQIYLNDLQEGLSENYTVKEIDFREFSVDSLSGQIDIATKYHSLQLFSTLIIAKPQTAFTDLDKLFLDQFLMRGGKLLWMVDAVHAEMDSLQRKGELIAFPKRDLNIEDFLFKYGVRINTDIVKDISCSTIPMSATMQNGQDKFTMHPWYYFPEILPEKTNSITNNLNTLKLQFTSSIDFITAKGISKTTLLKTSKYSGLKSTPSRITLKEAIEKPQESQFKAGPKVVGALLEGRFTSYFKNKLKPKNSIGIPLLDQGKESKMIVISDGDIGRNDVNNKGRSGRLGYDRYTKKQYANKKFLINCVDYLMEGKDIITLRNRDVKMRMMDRKAIKENYQFWQIVNSILPAILLLIFALLTFVIRKRKYTS